MIYASVNISKRMEWFVKDDKGELTDADISSFQDWTTDIVRVPETWVFLLFFFSNFQKKYFLVFFSKVIFIFFCRAYGFKISYERNKKNGAVKPGFYTTIRQIERPGSANDLLKFKPSFHEDRPTGLGLKVKKFFLIYEFFYYFPTFFFAILINFFFFFQGLSHQMEHLFNNLLLSPSTARGQIDLEEYRLQMAGGGQGENDENEIEPSSQLDHPTIDEDVFREANELSSAWIQSKEHEE